MGQGLSTMNQILPKEYYNTLRSLQSEALRTKGNDVFRKIYNFLNKIKDYSFFTNLKD